MSSVVARKQVFPAASDASDVDDGDASVSAGDFWPLIKLGDLRLAARITGGITTSRLMHVTIEAVAHVTSQFQHWHAVQAKAGFNRLEDVPETLPSGECEKLTINGENVKVYRFRRAVYSIARALVLEGYRDVDTTAKGDKDAAAMDLQRDDLWRDARWSIADIRGVPRLYAELC
ncbi:head completion/stabilization protein [Erwinia pyrifoliae]|uniref:head completion/stabilization protein n=1 Tax=Erwinia pyrifoliae TaxID=79967 RepID=UPI002202A817|nr:head completion/stabilization protein [Erwinia pyrifoliae]UWS30664.1 head completion/stabilization protein [Erwinia pyrifoliae]